MTLHSAVETVRRLGGPARTRQLIHAGVKRTDLGAAVHAGLLLRPRKGLYCLAETPAAIVESLSHCGLAACVSASREYGLWTLDLGQHERVHTWVDPEHRPVRVALQPHDDDAEEACCVFHRDAALDAPSLGRVGILHALQQIRRCRGTESFFAALESALRQKLIDSAQRATLRKALNRDDRWLVDFARSDADSGLESILRLRLRRHGISPATQVSIPGVGVVDFVIGDCLIVETAILAARARHVHRSTAGLTWQP